MTARTDGPTSASPERRIPLTHYREAADIVYRAAAVARHLPHRDLPKEELGDLLEHIGDELGDADAVEVEYPDRVNRRRMVAADHGRDSESDVWTAALALARVLTQGPESIR